MYYTFSGSSALYGCSFLMVELNDRHKNIPLKGRVQVRTVELFKQLFKMTI